MCRTWSVLDTHKGSFIKFIQATLSSSYPYSLTPLLLLLLLLPLSPPPPPPLLLLPLSPPPPPPLVLPSLSLSTAPLSRPAPVSSKLLQVGEYSLYGCVLSMDKVQLVHSNRETLLLSFSDAKVHELCLVHVYIQCISLPSSLPLSFTFSLGIPPSSLPALCCRVGPRDQ